MMMMIIIITVACDAEKKNSRKSGSLTKPIFSTAIKQIKIK